MWYFQCVALKLNAQWFSETVTHFLIDGAEVVITKIMSDFVKKKKYSFLLMRHTPFGPFSLFISRVLCNFLKIKGVKDVFSQNSIALLSITVLEIT